MANTNRIGGTLNFSIDGTQYAVRGSFEIMPNTSKKEGIAGLDGVHGYTEVPVVPEIKCDLTTMSNLDLTALAAINTSTIQVTLANGSTYVLSEAWSTSQFQVNAAEGRFTATFQGIDITVI